MQNTIPSISLLLCFLAIGCAAPEASPPAKTPASKSSHVGASAPSVESDSPRPSTTQNSGTAPQNGPNRDAHSQSSQGEMGQGQGSEPTRAVQYSTDVNAVAPEGVLLITPKNTAPFNVKSAILVRAPAPMNGFTMILSEKTIVCENAIAKQEERRIEIFTDWKVGQKIVFSNSGYSMGKPSVFVGEYTIISAPTKKGTAGKVTFVRGPSGNVEGGEINVTVCADRRLSINRSNI